MYHFQSIEPKWQAHWEQSKTFETSLDDHSRPKYYVLDMFPYPSSSGLHVGHVEGYTATDILARYKRACGFQVLHPMGWDAFGLPAEQYALQTGVHPVETTKKAIENFRRQLKRLGFSYDWTKEFATCDPQYYKWTQYLFQKLYEKGLAYQKEVPVNWCPALKTVLANEEVVDGKSERGGHPVYRVPMKQWMLRITAYAERLLRDLDKLDWPETTKDMQRHWIGRSEGLQLTFVAESGALIEVFTTRPDTIYGVTFLVLAPEHELVPLLTTEGKKAEVKNYQEISARKSEIARQEQTKEKSGVFTGAFALNPFSGERIPIYISDYVMMGYGTGAIMAVPGHDERDHDFAVAFQLPIKKVVQPSGGEASTQCFSGEGISIHSPLCEGLPTSKAKEKIISIAEEKKWGVRKVQYKLRDWLFSRQRYWGEPIPVLHQKTADSITSKLVSEKDLPVELPNVKSYEPTGTGESPLAAITDWVNVGDWQRETDTMPGSAGSSWYFLRYIDPRNGMAPFDSQKEKHWLPVDLYLGGPEHAVGHLLYARFWMKVFFDLGIVSHDEPFQKLVHQGMILGEDGEKMSKSRGNVVTPDAVIDEYGADSLRLYEMFMGPLDKEKPWSMSAIDGVHRFLNRTWRVFVATDEQTGDSKECLVKDEEASSETLRLFHKTVRQVSENIEQLKFNTAISQMMIFMNHMTKITERPRSVLIPFLQLLAPFAPHIAEELWQRAGESKPLSTASWPTFDPALAKDDLVTIAIQVLGKTRGTVEVEPGAAQNTVEDLAKKLETVAKNLEGKTIRKVIFVPNKILNFVVS